MDFIKLLSQIGKWSTRSLSVIPIILEAITVVELVKVGTGQQKQDACVRLIKLILTASETAVDKDLLDDAEVEAATRKVIDAIVALQNLIAARTLPPPTVG